MSNWESVTDDEPLSAQVDAADSLVRQLREVGGATGTLQATGKSDQVISFVSVYVMDDRTVACCFKDGEVIWIEDIDSSGDEDG